MSDNPYASPASCLAPRVGRLHRSEANGPFALVLTLVIPAAILWELAAPRQFAVPVPFEDFWSEVVFTLLVLMLPLAAFPFAIAGLRTSHRWISALAIVLGAAEAFVIYYAKFHPWMLRVLPA